MLQAVFEWLTNNTLLAMLAAIPLTFLVDTIIYVIGRIAGKDVKLNPLISALVVVGQILAMQALIVIGVAASTGTGWTNVVTGWWNGLLTWLDQWGTQQTNPGLIGGLIIPIGAFPWKPRQPFRRLRQFLRH